MTKPEFFIAGAPKCGTTAMQEYLRQHPGIFMPDMKEINHFADDLLKQDDPFLKRERYLSLFEGAGENQLAGEASVYYLFSKKCCTKHQVLLSRCKNYYHVEESRGRPLFAACTARL